MTIRYGVIGTGALGGFYGGMLARAGKDVHFLFNSDYQHVKKHGLRIDSISGNFHLSQVNAYALSDQMPLCDVLLVCLKTTNNHLLPTLLRPILHANSVVVLIQNGLGLEADLSQQMPYTAIAGGLAFICASKTGPGHITHHDYGKLNIGLHCGNAETILRQVCNDFNEANIPAHFVDDLNQARWQKLVWNIPFNGLTVVMNSATDQLIQQKYSRQLILEMMGEVIHAAHHCGAHIAPHFDQKMIELTENMAPYAPSMKLDYDNQRPMEIHYIYTRPLEIAHKAGFEMKRVVMLEAQLQFLEEKNRNR